MIGLMRTIGFLLIVVGVLIVLTWFIEPLREVWPWLLELPLPIRIGVIMAGLGLLVLLASLIWERFEDRSRDRELLDEP